MKARLRGVHATQRRETPFRVESPQPSKVPHAWQLDAGTATPDNATHERLAHRRQGHVETPTHREVDGGCAVGGDSGGVGPEHGKKGMRFLQGRPERRINGPDRTG